MATVLLGVILTVRADIVDIDDGALVLHWHRIRLVEVPVDDGAGSLRERLIQEFIEEGSTEEYRMTALTVEGGHNERCPAPPKRIDKISYRVFVN